MNESEISCRICFQNSKECFQVNVQFRGCNLMMKLQNASGITIPCTTYWGDIFICLQCADKLIELEWFLERVRLVMNQLKNYKPVGYEMDNQMYIDVKTEHQDMDGGVGGGGLGACYGGDIDKGFNSESSYSPFRVPPTFTPPSSVPTFNDRQTMNYYNSPNLEQNQQSPQQHEVVTMSAIRSCIEGSEQKSNDLLMRISSDIQTLAREVMQLKNESPESVAPPTPTPMTFKSETSLNFNPANRLLPKNPFETKEELMAFDQEMSKCPMKYQNLIAEFKVVKATNPAKFIRNCWRKVMLDSLAQHFCWRGSNSKESIRDFTITNAIREASVAISNTDTEEFMNITKSFFQFARNRVLQREMYAEKRNLNMNLTTAIPQTSNNNTTSNMYGNPNEMKYETDLV